MSVDSTASAMRASVGVPRLVGRFRSRAVGRPCPTLHDAATEAERLITWLRVMTRPQDKLRGCWYCGSAYGLEEGWRDDEGHDMPMCREHANLTRVGQRLTVLGEHDAAEQLAEAAGFGAAGLIPPNDKGEARPPAQNL